MSEDNVLGSGGDAAHYGVMSPEDIPAFPGVYLQSTDGNAIIMVMAVMVHGPDGDYVLTGNKAAKKASELIHTFAQDWAHPGTEHEDAVIDPSPVPEPVVVDGAKARKR